jgi:hypothetical protein
MCIYIVSDKTSCMTIFPSPDGSATFADVPPVETICFECSCWPIRLAVVRWPARGSLQKVRISSLDRFFMIELEPYTYEQFYEITLQLLSNQQEECAQLRASFPFPQSL